MPLGDALSMLRERRPLVHNVTNFVVMNWTANVLLALGASPVMAHAPQEVEEFAAMAGALVVDIGTLDPSFVEAMHSAAKRARKHGAPWILDPVGAGATRYRTRTAKALIARKPAIIRANAGELLALADKAGTTSKNAALKGVDSLADSNFSLDAARRLARRTGAVVAVTGATDYVTDGDRTESVEGGHAMSQQVTGTGCAATAVIGAFLAVEPPFEAAVHGLSVMKRAAARAAKTAEGPGSFAMRLLDAIAAERGEA
jgi:hydroxyethylthiazole kinase